MGKKTKHKVDEKLDRVAKELQQEKDRLQRQVMNELDRSFDRLERLDGTDALAEQAKKFLKSSKPFKQSEAKKPEEKSKMKRFLNRYVLCCCQSESKTDGDKPRGDTDFSKLSGGPR